METKTDKIPGTQDDVLTKLPNQLLFMDRLQQAILNARESNQYVAVIILGIDRFMLVNNSYGNLIGDKLLIQIAERIKKYINKNDSIARINADEFAILIPMLDSPLNTAQILDDIYKNISQVFIVESHEFKIQASIGVSIYPNDDDNPEFIFQNAITSMHTAKESGTGSFQFYTSDMQISVTERLELEYDLKRALERKEFTLQYQPQINILTNTLVGMEALIRWQHPVKGFISPMVFIPVLEETGLITVIGEWVLKTVCNQHRIWRKSGHHVPRISVNLSNRQFEDDEFLAKIEGIFSETGFDPQMHELEFEVTESLVYRDDIKIIRMLNQIISKNIHIAIDDFGTGYASLSYLTKFPIHSLKIDLSFIRRINRSESDCAIIIAIIAMAHSIGLTVISEGVEDDIQLAFLHKYQCDEVQGYYFSKPLRPDDMLSYLTGDSYKEIVANLNY